MLYARREGHMFMLLDAKIMCLLHIWLNIDSANFLLRAIIIQEPKVWRATRLILSIDL